MNSLRKSFRKVFLKVDKDDFDAENSDYAEDMHQKSCNKKCDLLLNKRKIMNSSKTTDESQRSSRSTTLSTFSTERESPIINIVQSLNKNKDVCLIEDSPYYIHRVAQSERLDEFKKLYYDDPTKFYLRDAKYWLPIHYAAFKSRIKIIDFILEKSEPSMINEKLPNGNTPLHVAIEKGHLECCKYLIDRKADLTIKNKDEHTPLHYCVVNSKPEILDMMLSHENMVDIHIGGENGRTALHYCAYYDNLECAQILINHNVSLCKPCQNGFFPIHTAATRCSNKVLRYLLDVGNKRGCTKLKMLSFVDGDNNKPLHSAVQFGNIEAVKLCLENGAHIDEVIESDNSTPVHLACAQGSLEILKIMLETESQLKDVVLHMQDKNLMTPLHKACMFDHVDVAAYLIENGAHIDAMDREKRSPLLLAASRNCLKVVCYLLSQNASIKVKDSKLRNLLHLVVNQPVACKNQSIMSNSNHDSRDSYMEQSDTNPHSLLQISNILMKNPHLSDLTNEQDIEGCTVMHYASKLGYVSCLRVLIQFGANLSTKNNEKQSPLHFAAKYGRYNSCLQFLSSPNYKNYINEKDNIGCTPLHLAAQNGHSKVVKLLMQNGAFIYKSFNGNNPFHEAALNGYTNCMSILYNIDTNVLNSTNKNGDTALHLAAQEGHANVVEYLLNCGAALSKNKDELTFIDLAITQKHESVLLTTIAHNRWQEVFDIKSKLYKTPLMGIIEYSSEVTQAFLERCISRKDIEGSNGKKYTVSYNFKYLNWSEEITSEKGKKKFTPMLPLLHMVNFGRTDCLSHKLCEIMLRRKWVTIIWDLNIIIYGLLLMLTLIVTTHPTCIHVYNWYHQNNRTISDNIMNDPNSLYVIFRKYKIYIIMAALCIAFCVLEFLKEIYQFTIDKMDYFRNFQVYIQMVLYISSIVFLAPFLYTLDDSSVSLHFQWEAGSVAIFTAWFNLLLFMQRFYVFGIYVVMFTEILKTLLKVIFLFSILIIAFGLVFFILLRDEQTRGNVTPLISIFRTIIMMVGEIDGVDSFIRPFTDDSIYTLHYGVFSILFLLLFIILVPILLTNLLIGLAVGDIESVQRNARLKREAMQIQLHIDLERKMPRKMLEKVDESEYSITYGVSKCEGTILSKFFTIFESCEVQEPVTDDAENNQLIYIELIKQKQRINTMKNMMNQQMDLLKLIVQKMDIKTENDDNDTEGFHGNYITHDAKKKKNLWSSKVSNIRLRNLLLKQLITQENTVDENNQ